MSLHDLSLWRDGRRVEFQVEGESFQEVIARLAPYLHEDAHMAHAGTGSDVIHMALIRADLERKREAFERAVALVQEAERSALEGEMERGAGRGDTDPGEGQES